MTVIVTGTVESANPIQKTSKAGKPYTVTETFVSGRKFNVMSSGIKTSTKQVHAGMNVSVVETQNGNYKNYEIVDAPHGTANATPAASAAPSSAPAQTQSFDERQNSIRTQSARKDAVAVVRLLVETGAISKTAAKDESIILGAVAHYTSELFKLDRDIAANPTNEIPFPSSKKASSDESAE